ncbi:MAG: acetyltransferase [Zoogloea sp.]|nr:acetyltransferase [Zoogloea sp.]
MEAQRDAGPAAACRKLIVVGGGGFGREVIWLARDCGGAWDVAGVLDDSDEAQGSMLSDVPVLGRPADWMRFDDACFVVAVGAPRTRRRIVEDMLAQGSPRFATLVHPSVRMSSYVAIGAGSIVAAGAILTTQIVLGRHVILNLAVTVGHDTHIADFCTVAPIVAVSGHVAMEPGVEVGTGSSLRQGVRLGRGAMVGMGSVVTRDVPPGVLALGSPARAVRQLEPFQVTPPSAP